MRLKHGPLRLRAIMIFLINVGSYVSYYNKVIRMASVDEDADRKRDDSSQTQEELSEDEYDALCADDAYLEFLRNPVTVSSKELMKRYGLRRHSPVSSKAAAVYGAIGSVSLI